MDIYIQTRKIDEPLSATVQHGRFCGHSLAKVPQVLVSMYNIIVLDFYADKAGEHNDDHMGDLGFNGTYEFIPSGKGQFGFCFKKNVVGLSHYIWRGAGDPVFNAYIFRSSNNLMISIWFAFTYETPDICYWSLKFVI